MKPGRIAVILTLLALLAGCRAGEPETTPPTETEPPAPVTEATEPPTEPVTEPTEPEWPEYEAYFRQEVAYRLSGKQSSILDRAEAEELTQALSKQEAYAGCDWACSDDDWIYGIRDKKELFRIDYNGENYETLFLDGIHVVGMYPEDADPAEDLRVFIADGCVLFFPVSDGQTVSVCRMYLPEKKTDVLCSAQQDLFQFYTPETNQAIIWWEENPEFPPVLEAELADPNSRFYGDPPDSQVTWDCVATMYKVPYSYRHYFNSVMDRHVSLGNYGFYDPRTQENIQKYGEEWWKDVP